MDLAWPRPRWHSGKEPTCQCRRHKRPGFNPWVRKIPWRRAWQPTPAFLPGKFHKWAWWATVHGVTKSQTWLSTHTYTWPWRDKKIPLLSLEEELMMEAWRLLKKDKEVLPPTPPFFLWLRNCSPVSSQGVASLTCPFVNSQASYSNKSLLTRHFSSRWILFCTET